MTGNSYSHFGKKSRSLISKLKQASLGGKDLNCKNRAKPDKNMIFFSRRFIHGFGFQKDLKIWSSNEVRHK